MTADQWSCSMDRLRYEWAMVYWSAELRHAVWPLRLGPDGTDAVLESLPVRCTHDDAFRFFAADARPFNALQPWIVKDSTS